MKYLGKESFMVPVSSGKHISDLDYEIAVGLRCAECEQKKCVCRKRNKHAE